MLVLVRFAHSPTAFKDVAIVEIEPYRLERAPVTPEDDSPEVTGERGTCEC